MGLFVINTVAPGGEEHRIPDYMLNKSYQMLEKFIRTAYGKPSEDYELHIHYESKCTKSDDVPPASFNIFIELDTLFSESNPRLEYYVCFIPKTDNPTPHLPKTPVSLSQSIERDVASIIPVPDGAPGSDVNNPIMIQPEDLDPVMAEKAYKFFLAHQLPVPYQRRFEVGVINKRKVPEKWNLDKNAQMNKVTVQLDNGCQVSHYCMNKDENDRPLTTPTNSKIRLDMVNYWPGIQMMYDKERLRIFLSRYNDSLKNGVPFEDAQPVIANLKRRVNNKATNASNPHAQNAKRLG
ncbi:hypothetical protein SLS58_003158 [Diplodia intermedia]|uniref:Uncharacterized protein n=1 Tax=Diplodia intermedia TaxID=856260 RepID=A0ABR3TX08_9PEZI